jgi:hypothetical protein
MLLLLLTGLLGLTPALPGMHPQRLTVALHRDNASLVRLPHYHAATPIDVQVGGETQHVDAVMVTAHGPDGTSIHAPLARTATGFEGLLNLAQPGAWTIELTTQLGAVTSAVNAVSLDVEPGGSDLAGYATMALALLMTAAGVLVIVRRERAAALVAVVTRRNRR